VIYLLAPLIYLAVILATGYGWVMNIVAICHTSFASFDGLLVARCIGVFVAPLGAVLGYF